MLLNRLSNSQKTPVDINLLPPGIFLLQIGDTEKHAFKLIKKTKNLMMKTFLFLFVFFFTSYISSAQQFEWANKFGNSITNSNQLSSGKSIAIDKAGNIYTTGFFADTVDFDPGSGTFNLFSAGGLDIFISKFSTSGTFLWAKRIGGLGRDVVAAIKIDTIGNIFITGDVEGTVDFDPGVGVFNLTAGSQGNTFICKLDTTGNFVFAKATGGTTTNSLAIDNAGNIYTAGLVYSSGDFDPGPGTYYLYNGGIFISKLNAAGNLLWAKNIGTFANIDCYAIDLDNYGNVYATGFFANTTDFNPGTSVFNLIPSGIYRESFVWKLNSLGNFVWARKIGGSKSIGTSINVEPNGNIYSTGSFTGTRDMDPGTGVFNLSTGSEQNDDMYISKLDTAGNFLWAKSIGGPGPQSCTTIKTDSSGNIYTTGNFWSDDTDFDPGAGIFKMKITNRYFDIFISKLNNSGEFIWAKRISGSNNNNEKISNSIFFGKNNKLYTTGSFVGTVDFDPGSGEYNLTSGILRSAYVHAMCNFNILISTNPVICGGNNLNLTVNTVAGATYNWTGPNSFTSTTQNPTISNTTPFISGNYTVTVNNGCSASETIGISVKPKPVIIPVSNSPICVGDTLKLSVNDFGFSATYSWSGPNNFNYYSQIPFNPNHNPSILNATIAASGTYKIVIIDSNSCKDSNTVNVIINPKPTLSISSSSNSVCFGNNITLTATGAKTYNWTGGITNGISFKASNLQTYDVIATDSNGCVSIGTKQIIVNNLPSVSFNTLASTQCSGPCNGSIEISGFNGTPPYSYLWDSTLNNKTTAIVNSLCQGKYSVRVGDYHGCFGYDTTSISIASISNPNIYLTNLAAIDQVNISPSFASYYSYNLPATITPPLSNPRNFVDPGKKARFKVECTNKKANGQSVVSGICKVRSNNPYILITDSSSALNNIGWNNKAWSADEFEIDINPNTPPGTNAYIDFVVQESGNNYITSCIAIPIRPLVYSKTTTVTIDDDSNPDSKGNDNDTCDANEIIEFYPWLNNTSTLNAEYVRGKLENLDNHNYINIWNGVAGVGTTVYNSTWWNFSFGKPQTISSFDFNTTPEYDFVFNHNTTNTKNNFNLYMVMAGGFKLFSDTALSLVQWSLPYNFVANSYADTLTLDKYTMGLPNSSTSAVLNVSSNRNWTSSGVANWVTLTPGSGTGNANLNVTVGANPGSTIRTNTITFTAGTVNKTLTITQDAAVGLNEIKSAIQINIYPNPSSGIFTFENYGNQNCEVQLFDVNGMQADRFAIQANRVQTLDYTHLSDGLYLIFVRAANGSVFSSKVLVSK